MRSAIISKNAETSTLPGKRDIDFSVKAIIGSQETSEENEPKVTLPNHKYIINNGTSNTTPSATYNFTMDNILQYFFGKVNCSQAENEKNSTEDKVQIINKDCDGNSGLCVGAVCQQKISDQHPVPGPLQSLRKLVNTEKSKRNDKEAITYAIASFPPEVKLCASSIPGHIHGVCARQLIPIGTWIGPFEGARVSAEEIHEGMDMSYMWEVYQGGCITSYLDGKDENVSSWMRFIRCARHKDEQNLFVFQYGDNIYYRAYKDITPETELLVWYDDQYEKFLGVPIQLRYENMLSTGDLFHQNMDLITYTKSPHYPQSSRVPLTQPLHCDTQFQSKTSSNNTFRPKQPTNVCGGASTKLSAIQHESSDGRKDTNCVDLSPRENSEGLEAGAWRCGQCFKSFTQRSLLQIHVCPRLPEKPYQCGHCAQSFAHPTDLRTHVVTHNSERPFKCGFCGRSFAGSTTLNNHIRTHTGQKPFVCEKCSRSFSQASQLSRHQRLPGDCCHRNTNY